jgi:Secretion system C-terminal sorting domain
MKPFLLQLLLFFTVFLTAQTTTNKLLFSYDTAGNQIQRSLCVSCPAGLGRPGTPVGEGQTSKTPETVEVVVLDKVTFYPNPVLEELHIKWELIEGKSVASISVYNFNGALLQTLTDLKNETNTIVPFASYPNGTYIVSVVYSDGDSKNMNIVKK